MTFQVGDRVVCVEHTFAGSSGTVGNIYRVTRSDDWLYGDGEAGDRISGCRSERFRLVEPEREEHVGYYVVYRTSEGQLHASAYASEQSATQSIEYLEQRERWTVVAKKKIKTRI